MPERPLLIFPAPTAQTKLKRPGGPGSGLQRPTVTQQVTRLDPQFERLQQAMETRRLELQASATGITPERVLVLETIGPVQRFIGAVKRIQGLDWLADIETAFEPDENFYNLDREDKELTGHLYLLMTDGRALKEVQSLWRRFPRGEDWARGFTPWRDAFAHLRNIRPWSVEDRLRETGLLQEWQERLEANEESATFEVELWFRPDSSRRSEASRHLRRLITEGGGRVIAESVIEAIHYHGMLAEMPIQGVARILAEEHSQLLHCDHVMFYRPRGQSAYARDAETSGAPLVEPPSSLPTPDTREPIAALLDGMPLERHELLRDRLLVDDPEGWSAEYPAAARTHGTSMASCIVRGDYSAGESPLARPLYTRPILYPVAALRGFIEESPRDRLLVDLLHQAVRRIAVGEGNEPPVAPTVRVVNLSLGDRYRCFDGQLMSPWARLLDWLAWQYKLLFIVSAGNHLGPIELDGADRRELEKPAVRASTVLQALVGRNAFRRLRVPAESVNALTVGAAHRDATSWAEADDHRRVELNDCPGLASPISAQGFGYRGSIKPELLAPGGRLLYGETLAGPAGFSPAALPRRAPGVLGAWPGAAGAVNEVAYVHGTSVAAALTTRAAAQLYEVLEGLRAQHGHDHLPEDLTPVLLKALLVHGARWGVGRDTLASTLGLADSAARKTASRLLGFGHLDVQRVAECTERRATLLGSGYLKMDGGHEYAIPLPDGLSGVRGLRRLVITLAWLSPVDTLSQRYRKAVLWFKAPGGGNVLQVKRREVPYQATASGTVQHEVLEGEEAAAYGSGRTISVQVSCAADAGKFEGEVPYALAVTLEVGAEVDVRVYQSVQAAVLSRVRARPR